MHEYSIDIERSKLIFYIAVVSIGISGLTTTVFNKFILTVPFIEFTISVTAMSVFGIVFKLFDKYFWKWEWLRGVGLVQTPNLNGTWKGYFSSSFHEFEKEFPAELVIEQTWTEICIQGKFRHSKSSSYTTSIKVRDGFNTKLFYSYQNEKNPEQFKEPFSDHKGYGSLEINYKEQIIDGYYFNNPSNNSNHGILHLIRAS